MNNLKINKDPRDINFTTISLTIYDDNRLSWRAKGLHTYLMSRPAGWKLYENDMLNRAKDQRTSLRSALKELIDFGYLVIKQERSGNGKFLETNYEIFESPQSGFLTTVKNSPESGFLTTVNLPLSGSPISGKPLAGKPLAGNVPYNIYNISNKELNNELFTNVNNSTDENLTDDEYQEITKILNYYNYCVDKIRYFLTKQGIDLTTLDIPSKHKSIYSKCTISLPTEKSSAKTLPLIYIIYTFLKTEDSSVIYKALDNYTKVYISNAIGKDEYYYKVIWKTLGQFIYSGLYNNTGYKSLLDIDKLKRDESDIYRIRNTFKPITKKWDTSNILDKERNTYFGFPTDELRNTNAIKDDIKDISWISGQPLQKYGYFEKLERAISSIFFMRKTNKLDLNELITLLKIWYEEKDRWKRIVSKMNK